MGIVSCLLMPSSRAAKTNSDNRGIYEKKWLVEIDDPNHHGKTILELCRNLEETAKTQKVDKYSDPFIYLDARDDNARAQEFDVDPYSDDKADWNLFYITAKFYPWPDDGGGGQDPRIDPLDWRTQFWGDWHEVTVPEELGSCMTNLPSILRGPGFETPIDFGGSGIIFNPGHTPKAPFVNAAGQQTIDPLTKTIYNYILYAEKNYPSALNSNLLNTEFRNSVNTIGNYEDPPDTPVLFMGDAGHYWRYLISKTEKRHTKEYEGQLLEYYPTVTAIEFNPLTWDRLVLNNGQVCFRKTYIAGEGDVFIENPVTGKPLLLPAIVSQLKDDFVINTSASGNPGTQPVRTDFEEVPASEPVNLNTDGTQITDPDTPANHIKYYSYEEKDFNTLSPYQELVQEYALLFGGG